MRRRRRRSFKVGRMLVLYTPPTLRSSLRGTGPFSSMNFFIISLLLRPWKQIALEAGSLRTSTRPKSEHDILPPV